MAVATIAPVIAPTCSCGADCKRHIESTTERIVFTGWEPRPRMYHSFMSISIHSQGVCALLVSAAPNLRAEAAPWAQCDMWNFEKGTCPVTRLHRS
jgi:hypothetical protein